MSRTRRSCGALVLGALLLLLRAAAAASEPVAPAPLRVGDGERLLVIAPHPDDETIASSGLMQRVLERGGTVDVLLLTAGDGYVRAVRGETGKAAPPPADFIAYGERRLRESQAALRELDAERVRLTVIGFPDGNLADLLAAHWRRDNPARSDTTRAADPPYDALAADPHLPYAGEALQRELTSVLRALRPTMIALPDPLDVHPDHHAGGVFALRAIDEWLNGQHEKRVAREHPAAQPRLLAYLVHWPDWPPGWDGRPAPQADAAQVPLLLPRDLPSRHAHAAALQLSSREVDVKRRALACYATQQHQEHVYLASFVRASEPFTVLSLADARAHGDLERVRARTAAR